MTELATKDQLLKNFGYSYNFNRELHLNRTLKKTLSGDFIEDHSEESIPKVVTETALGRWQFFFNDGIPPGAESELAKLLG